MPNHGSCPECGRPLPEGALDGVCPVCSLRITLKFVSGGAPDVQPLPAAVPPAATPTQPALPRFGDYELLELLARGGMGVVYKARQISLNRQVALKRIAAGALATAAEVERFHTEAEAIARLQHPNIVAIHEIGEHDGEHYFSMDYIAGRTLAEVVREGPLPAARAATYVKAVALAVHYAHQHGIIHRDLKPSNILIDSADQPRITDFGLAKKLTDSQLSTLNPQLTLSGQVLGSPNYLPPEQAEPHRGATGPPSDVYALGAILYHLVTGRPPFQAQSLTTLLRQVIENEPVAPRLLNPNIPRDLETICLRCLQKEPARRYGSAQALADDLECWLRAEPIQARRATHVERVWLWCRRQPVRASLVGALILVFALGLTGVLWQWHRASRTAQAELRQRARAEAGEYAADMHLAQLALADNNRPLAVSLLDKYRPGGKSEIRNPKSEPEPSARKSSSARLSAVTRHPPPVTDLRGWEWRYLWQLCQGDESFTLHRFPREVVALAVSKDGKVLAAATWDEVVLWDLASRQRLTGFPSEPRPVLAFSPTEDLLAVGARTAAGQPGVGFWDLGEGKIARTLVRDAEVKSVAFSPDGRLLATFDIQGNVRVVDWKSGQTLTNLTVSPPRYGTTGLVAFSPDGSRLAIGPGYGRTQLLDLHTRTNVLLQTQPIGVTSLAFSPAADLVAASYAFHHGTIVLCDARTGELRAQLTNHTAEAGGLAFTPDGRQLASANDDGTLRIWSVADGTELRCLQSSHERLEGLVMLPDGRTLVTGGSGGSVCFWDATGKGRAPNPARIRISAGFDAFPELGPSSFAPGRPDARVVRRFGIAFTPDSRRFITLDYDGSLALWETCPARLIEKLPALGSNHWGVALSPDGHWLATGECSGTVTIWDWTAPRSVASFTLPFGWFSFLRFSASGHFLFATAMSNDWVVSNRIWQTDGWKEVPLKGSQFAGLWSVDLSPDERFLAASYGDGDVKLFRYPSGKPEATFRGHTGPVPAVRFWANGGALASASLDGSARLWDLAARRAVMTLRGHSGMAASGTLSPDGRRWATGGVGPTDAVKLWDLVAHRELLTLRGEGQYFVNVAFSPDGNTLAATCLSGIAHLWRAPSWEEIEAAERRQGTAALTTPVSGRAP